ncbi:hypothetical protein Shyd_93660 [Streptomyces hydrogenans]|uniref:Uncharacterized protein n=1 Tax=Streptomyces hydrogenans TaxID=1873719 RepID=A0ABQ3PSM1_9ACTN|nr:hypothetical protein [Streptomyces hydrogenans]GHI27995.1 hypothetical protein Shyd_93660 [Streptomyces hydrogenans]
MKAALHRAAGAWPIRSGKLRSPAVQVPTARPSTPSPRRSRVRPGRLTKLFVEDAVSDVIGVAHEVGRAQIAAGSLHHTLVLEPSVRWRAEVRELDGDRWS